ncbi:hypothetical protein H4S01_004327, partial [Coemansia sp. RSA 2610]
RRGPDTANPLPINPSQNSWHPPRRNTPRKKAATSSNMTRLKQELAEERLIRPATTMPTLYLDCDNMAEQDDALAYAKALLAGASTDTQELALAAAARHFMRLAVLPRTWATYDKLIKTPVVRNGVPYHWYQADDRLVRIIAGGCGVVELALVECALRGIGRVHDLKHNRYQGYATDEFTATIILPPNTELPDEVVLRSAGGQALQIERVCNDLTPFCATCRKLSYRRCPHDRRLAPPPELDNLPAQP